MSSFDDLQLSVVWQKVCEQINDRSADQYGGFVTYDEAHTFHEDARLCALAAENGDERALRYMVKFMELRMKS